MGSPVEIARLNLALELVSACAGLTDAHAVTRLVGERLRWVFHFDSCLLALRSEGSIRWLAMGPGDEALVPLAAGELHICRELAETAMATGAPAGSGRTMKAIAHPLGDPLRPLGALCVDGGAGYSHRDLRFMLHVCSGLGAALSRIDQAEQLILERAESAAAARAVELARAAGEAAMADNAAKDAFLAMLGHELRNPLSPILASAELLRREASGATLQKVLVIERQARHLDRLVGDLLDISRITTGKISLRSEALDLRDIAVAAAEMAGPRMREKSQPLSVELPESPVWARGDYARLVQVAANLLNNASAYSSTGSGATMRVAATGGEALLEVLDSGIGIAPELIGDIFGLFVQGGRSLELAPGGLGLGLGVARSITELHGGRIWASSEGEGRGSRFTVALPLAAGAEPPRPAVDSTPDEAASPASRRVLLVDDNVDAADSMAELLRAYGHIVMVAYAPGQALAAADDFKPDVAVLDIGMPEMDGYALAALMRERLGAAAPAMVALTGYGQDADRDKALSLGFRAHLAKPASLAALIESVERT